MGVAMAKAKSTTITKSYEGDEGAAGDDLWSTLSQLAFLAVMVVLGWFVFG